MACDKQHKTKAIIEEFAASRRLLRYLTRVYWRWKWRRSIWFQVDESTLFLGELRWFIEIIAAILADVSAIEGLGFYRNPLPCKIVYSSCNVREVLLSHNTRVQHVRVTLRSNIFSEGEFRRSPGEGRNSPE